MKFRSAVLLFALALSGCDNTKTEPVNEDGTMVTAGTSIYEQAVTASDRLSGDYERVIGPRGIAHRIDSAIVIVYLEAAGSIHDGTSDVLRNPGDDYSKSVFDPAVRGKTDRFILRFRKPL